MNWNIVADALSDCGIVVDRPTKPRRIGGGNFSEAWQLQATDGPLFLKTATKESFDMLDAEACGLRELAKAQAIRVPNVYAVVDYEDGALLALEWLELSAPSAGTARILGRQLAALHRYTHREYGWYRDNTIGSTPQHNSSSDSWLDFYREHRLQYQLRLACEKGFGCVLQAAGQKLLDNLDALFADDAPAASILHGDLWGGNWSAVNGQPVIYDPAVYYGDRETDLAMTRLFGGFSPDFYAAYSESWPLNDGHERRVGLYQLYHVLNHLNLFGGGYLGQAVNLLEGLAEI
jgi:protein-ribulosamine 3-kinase